MRTLPLSAVSVIVGTGVAVAGDPAGATGYAVRDDHAAIASLCMVVALCLQIGVNYTNDYSDGVRGTDAFRVGPARLTGSGRATPRSVLSVGLAFYGLAAVAGLAVVLMTQYWWLLAVGVVAIAAAWYYTGGKRPYGYHALGEVSVFVFFGLVPVLGTQFAQIGRITVDGWAGAVAVGFFACGALMINNIRDLAADREAGKRTLAVRIGPVAARVLYALFLKLPFLALLLPILHVPLAIVAGAALALALTAARIGLTEEEPLRLIKALQLTSLSSLAFGVLLAGSLVFDAAR
ncbi:1,4-dihydroxy-2-naphthoate polyprenyltransferase [Conyzicola nivalis]|uniref:1,4-dihydroxy-2-naphthoate octaprenyltransferase n=1 Tax=Conyzicola nivalis TaxID=1477021 RepID=A0A916WKG0_9MICO|nr:1,4-dihydroxy-2-naphthoate octaprenyltransferase [Conyzicola nivalis]